MVPVLGYWKTRCLAQPIRLLLAYKGVEFEDKKYEVGDPPDYDKTCWFSVKYKLGLDFPNLPYYIDDDVKLTQTLAILRYLARKYDLVGTTEEERTRTDILASQAMDLGYQLFDVVYQHYDRKSEYLRQLPPKLKEFSDFLGHRTWFAGEHLTFADFLIYEFLEHHLYLSSTSLDGFPKLQQFMRRIENLPTIKAYMESPAFMREPVFNKYYQSEIERRTLKAADQANVKQQQ